MRIENFSLKTVVVSILLALGLMSTALAYFSGLQLQDAALDAQTKVLERVIRVSSEDSLQQLREHAWDINVQTQNGRFGALLDQLLRNPDDAGLQAQLRGYLDVSINPANPSLRKLRVYDADFNLLLESSKGETGLPNKLPTFLFEQAKARPEVESGEPLHGLWIAPQGPRQSLLAPVANTHLIGYLEVVSDPLPRLQAIGLSARIPLRVETADGTLLSQSEDWQAQHDGSMAFEYLLPAANGAAAARILAQEDVTDLLDVTDTTLWSTTLAFMGISLLGLMVAVMMLNRFIFAPVDAIARNMASCAEGDYSNTMNTHALKELHDLAEGFNTMSKQVQDNIERERQTGEDIQGKVELIQEIVELAGKGDLTGQLMVYRDNDVISELANGIQTMLDSLNSLVSRIQQSGIQVTSSATEIAATSKQQEATATEQAATTNEIKTTVTEISATSKELVNTMNEVTDVAWKTSEGANTGRRALQRMEQTMHHMMEATSSIGSKLAVLSEKAGNINTVVTTITKVADQTNLLSLNAAIEAEKAGEYGVGFAVVATEIRRLADQTAVATWDIEQMVKEMQSAVSAGVMGMEKFSEEVRQGVSDVGEVGGQLTAIIEQVEALIPRFEEVHEGMQAQSQAGGQIRDAMVQLSESATQTAESLRQSNGAIQQLNDAARGLQGAASHFTVSD